MLAFLITLALADSSFSADDIPAFSSARVIADIRFEPELEYNTYESAMVRDEAFTYVATPGGLYRLPRTLQPGAQAELVAFAGRAISNLYVHDGALYLLKGGHESDGAPAADHTLLRSTDRALTFTPLDQNLEECIGRYCSFLHATEAIFRDGTMIVNAGGNVLSTRDGGLTWTPLVGSIAQQACYHPTIELIGQELLIGGECPLDVAYVRRGSLRSDFSGWTNEPSAVTSPFLENRNVQFIRRVRESDTVIAGIEGAILRSTDRGASFDFAYREPIEAADSYIYFTTFLAPERSSRLLIGGFNKADNTIALMTTDDDGVSWKDRGYLVRSSAHHFDSLAFLHEDADGRILAGLVAFDEKLLRIVELNLESARRRSIRR